MISIRAQLPATTFPSKSWAPKCLPILGSVRLGSMPGRLQCLVISRVPVAPGLPQISEQKARS